VDSITRKHEGAGISLALARKLSARIGGQLEITSPAAPGRPEESPGTRFSLRLSLLAGCDL